MVYKFPSSRQEKTGVVHIVLCTTIHVVGISRGREGEGRGRRLTFRGKGGGPAEFSLGCVLIGDEERKTPKCLAQGSLNLWFHRHILREGEDKMQRAR